MNWWVWMSDCWAYKWAFSDVFLNIFIRWVKHFKTHKLSEAMIYKNNCSPINLNLSFLSIKFNRKWLFSLIAMKTKLNISPTKILCSKGNFRRVRQSTMTISSEAPLSKWCLPSRRQTQNSPMTPAQCSSLLRNFQKSNHSMLPKTSLMSTHILMIYKNLVLRLKNLEPNKGTKIFFNPLSLANLI